MVSMEKLQAMSVQCFS